MLAIRLLVRPWSARFSRSSFGRATNTDLFASSKLTFISGRNVQANLPFGPSTWIVDSATDTFTLAGTGTGLRPIRDMGTFFLSQESSCRRCRAASLDDRQNLAANLVGAGLAVADHAPGSAEDLDPHAPQRRLQLLVPAVYAAPGLAHAVDSRDQPFAVRTILHFELKRPRGGRVNLFVVPDVPFLLEHLGNPPAQLRGG